MALLTVSSTDQNSKDGDDKTNHQVHTFLQEVGNTLSHSEEVTAEDKYCKDSTNGKENEGTAQKLCMNLISTYVQSSGDLKSDIGVTDSQILSDMCNHSNDNFTKNSSPLLDDAVNDIGNDKSINKEDIALKRSPNSSFEITREMVEEEKIYKVEEAKQLEELKTQALEELARTGKQERFNRLQELLSRSKMYSTYLLGRVNARREADKLKAEKKEKRKKKEEEKEKVENKKLAETCLNDKRVRKPNDKIRNKDVVVPEVKKKGISKKRKTIEVDVSSFVADESSQISKKQKVDESNDETLSSQPQSDVRMINGEEVPEQQPRLLTGGVMRSYQIEGLEWLRGLYENGINGILADEMGLGKTLQSIALITALIEQKVLGPFIIAAPLSTLPNWIAEFKRFAPEVYTILYHGSKDRREELRRKMMRIKRYSDGFASLPVVVSSYEVLLRDRKLLEMYNVEWKYMIVDEGHRIKNMNCKLIRELKLYNTANRLLLTGTPLQNNLAELWALLNFLLPDIFDDLHSFQSWFDFSAISDSKVVADEHEATILQTLHSILTPFLLRRLKTDVDLSIPPKKEVIVYAPLTGEQENYYKSTLDKTVLDMIEKKNNIKEPQEYTPSGRPKRRSTVGINYNPYFSENDEEFNLEALVKQIEDEGKRKEDMEFARSKKVDKKSLVNVRLVNVMMQLRKCCNHPYLLEYPYDPVTQELAIDEGLVKNSGKMLMLDRMLVALIKRGHKVLIFSQLVTMLDIIADYCSLRHFKFSRLDGSMDVLDRQDNIARFESEADNHIFLLSTRAGGLGLNLMMADTVIIYDSDWNPQADIQAQDRCHRIGQTKPVVVYRFVTANTIDQRIIERASCKRKLEKMVIHSRNFKGHTNVKGITSKELIDLLNSNDVESTVNTECVISDEQLDILLDRSDLIHKENPAVGSKIALQEDSNENAKPSDVPKLFTVKAITTEEVAF